MAKGCYDSKVTSASMARNLEADVICGMTTAVRHTCPLQCTAVLLFPPCRLRYLLCFQIPPVFIPLYSLPRCRPLTLLSCLLPCPPPNTSSCTMCRTTLHVVSPCFAARPSCAVALYLQAPFDYCACKPCWSLPFLLRDGLTDIDPCVPHAFTVRARVFCELKVAAPPPPLACKKYRHRH